MHLASIAEVVRPLVGLTLLEIIVKSKGVNDVEKRKTSYRWKSMQLLKIAAFRPFHLPPLSRQSEIEDDV